MRRLCSPRKPEIQSATSFKSPLPNSRLERFEHGAVTSRFNSHRTGNTVHQTLPSHVFLQRLLQHVLPPRLHRARGYGLLAPRSKVQLDRAHGLLRGVADTTVHSAPEPVVDLAPTAGTHRCPFCERSLMRRIAMLTPERAMALAKKAAAAARAPP